MFVIYVAGPYRGKDNYVIHQNVAKAEALALEVWKMGNAAAICPHLNTEHFQGAAPDEVWLNGDLELIRRSDALLVVPGYESSSGTRAEIEFAHKWEIPVFYTVLDLKRWLDQGGGGRIMELPRRLKA